MLLYILDKCRKKCIVLDKKESFFKLGLEARTRWRRKALPKPRDVTNEEYLLNGNQLIPTIFLSPMFLYTILGTTKYQRKIRRNKKAADMYSSRTDKIIVQITI